MKTFSFKTLTTLLAAFVICLLLGMTIVFYFINYYSKNLPDYEQLKNYNPSVTTRLYAANGSLIKEYAEEKRLFVPIELVPQDLINAFLAAEDSNFYNHQGVDVFALARAVIYNIFAYVEDRPMIGASTITQQVVKNFLLSSERTLQRKAKEAILAFRMTQVFPKDKILELYLNQIYLGMGSYGVAAASLNYFNKSIDELTIEECALIAAMPKAPGRLDPRKNPEGALDRRNWVIDRMKDEGFINIKQAIEAKGIPINLQDKDTSSTIQANLFADAVKRELVNMYTEEGVMKNGYLVRTTLDPELQKTADKMFKKGIERYDMKHGYRGPLGKIQIEKDDWQEQLTNFAVTKPYDLEWEKAVVLNVSNNKITIGFKNNDNINEQEDDIKNTNGIIPLKNLEWARKYIDVDTIGKPIQTAYDVGLRKGDVILVKKSSATDTLQESPEYLLKQIPEVNGAMIVMDPHTGRVKAMVGGYLDLEETFNRATQASRQPGSALKTFAYIAALENGFNPASKIMDEEIILDQGQGLPPYVPHNYSEQFYGLTTLRIGLEQSRNVTTVRLAQEVGLDKIVDVIKRFGINEKPKKIYSVVLGSVETDLIKLVNSYAMIVNGGKKISPALIERIQDKHGKTIYRRDMRNCTDCLVEENANKNSGNDIGNIVFPELLDTRETVISSETAYQITSMLEGVVQRGTGWKAKAIGKPIGGKTGTTNSAVDSWFIGFTPDLVAGTYVGFDIPATLGTGETGSSIALPIFVDFMKAALKDEPSIPFRVPFGIKLVRIDRNTGNYPTPSTLPQDIIFEAFKLEDKVGVQKIDIEENSSQDNINELDQIIDEIMSNDNENNESDNKNNEEINLQGIY